MDAVIIIILLVVVGFYFKRFDKIIMGIGIVDIFLRIFNYLVNNIQINGISEYVEKYLPASIPAIINNYTKDMIADMLMWVYVICMGIFLFYCVRYFIRKK